MAQQMQQCILRLHLNQHISRNRLESTACKSASTAPIQDNTRCSETGGRLAMLTVLIVITSLGAICALLAGVFAGVAAARAENVYRDDPRFAFLYRKGSVWWLLAVAISLAVIPVILNEVRSSIESPQELVVSTDVGEMKAGEWTESAPTSTSIATTLAIEVFVDDDADYDISSDDSFYTASNFAVHLDGGRGIIEETNYDGRVTTPITMNGQQSYGYVLLDRLAKEYVDITRSCAHCVEAASLPPGGQSTLKFLVSRARATLQVSVFLDRDGNRRITDADSSFTSGLGTGTFTVTVAPGLFPKQDLAFVDNGDKDRDARFGVIEQEVDLHTDYAYVGIEFSEELRNLAEHYVDVTKQCLAGCYLGVQNLPLFPTGQLRLLVAVATESAPGAP